MTGPDFEQRPWGQYQVLCRFPLPDAQGKTHDVVIKKITVEPGKRLSYQSHQGRTEHWYVITGSGTVLINDKESSVEVGSSIEIPKGTKHRVGSNEKGPLVFIEVSTGLVDESDIIRYQDDFGRAPSQ